MADLRKPANIDRRTWISMGLVVLGTIGALDAWTGSAFSSALFYLLPIAIVTSWCPSCRPP